MNEKLVHIHEDPAAFTRSPMARLHLLGDIGSVFTRLNERLEGTPQGGKPFISRVEEGSHDDPSLTEYIPSNITVLDPGSCRLTASDRPVRAPALFAELIRRLPRESRFFIDNSNSVPWSIHYFFHRRPEAFHLSIEFATMAWAIGAAVGSAFADRSSPSVCVTGDGCWLMSGQEITVAVERKLPVIFVVINDRAYGLIRHAHRMAGKEEVDFAIPAVDFAMMAEAVGAEGRSIRKEKDLERIDWREIALREGPTLLDVTVDPEERPPLAMA
jgi:acetolactate synthase-1/2/3 large subunit